MEERQTNYTIAESYKLPSKGLVYDKPVNTTIELRSMTARDELKRLSPSNTPLKKLSDIIEGCLIEKPAIHVYDMCLGDYEYLLHKLRIISYGPNYNTVVACPNCGDITETTINLETLKVKEFTESQLNEVLNFTLPKSDKKISICLQTPRIIDEIANRTKERKRRCQTSDIDFETLEKIITSIVTVDGEILSDIALEQFIYNLPALDMQKILNNIDKANALIGLDTSFIVSCSKCDYEIKTFFRFGPEFFRPTSI